MKLVALLRIKDQILTIDECLGRLSQLVDEIIILDNGSTDGTLEVYQQYPKITKILQTIGFDEGRDKIMLLEEGKKTSADWLIWIDGDEVFEKHLTRKILEKYMSSSLKRVVFRMCNFWLSRNDCRYDREYYLYTLHPQRSMWRNTTEAYFKNQKIHNGDIMGIPGRPYISPYRIKHYGYVYKQKIKEKMEIYTQADTDKSRDYQKTLQGLDDYKTFSFYEFENKNLNFAYILAYKYVCNFLWLVQRLKIRLVKIFK